MLKTSSQKLSSDSSSRRENDDLARGSASSEKLEKTDAYSVIPENFLKVEEVEIKCEGGQKADIKVDKKLIVTQVAKEYEEVLELGDLIVLVNESVVESRRQFTKLLAGLAKDNKDAYTIKITKKHTIEIRLDFNSPEIPPAEERCQGMHYLFAYLVLFHNGSLGLSVKGVNSKVYVTVVDNGWRSMSRRILRVGDSILKVGKTTVASVHECKELLSKELKINGYVSIVFERAQTTETARLVRFALSMEKKPEQDPRLADDALEICKEELARMEATPNPTVIPILKEKTKDRKEQQHIVMSADSLECSIAVDAANNPFLLLPCPPHMQRGPLQCRVPPTSPPPPPPQTSSSGGPLGPIFCRTTASGGPLGPIFHCSSSKKESRNKESGNQKLFQKLRGTKK